MNTNPRVSVVMPAFNAANFIRQSITSVLSQSFTDFELIIVNDGSIDATSSIVETFADPRIRHVQLPQNTGLASARNSGLAVARGSYIAWLDSDDLSHPKRLATQVKFLDEHPPVGLVGTWVRAFDQVGKRYAWRYPRRSAFLRCQILFDDPFATSSVMIRRGALSSLDEMFRDSFAPAEDYDLWERIACEWRVANIPAMLTRYRIHSAQTSTRDSELKLEAVIEIQARQLQRLGIEVDGESWRLHRALGIDWGFGLTGDDLPALDDWVSKLLESNSEKALFPIQPFVSVVKYRRQLVSNVIRSTPIGMLRQKLYTRTH